MVRRAEKSGRAIENGLRKNGGNTMAFSNFMTKRKSFAFGHCIIDIQGAVYVKAFSQIA